MNKNSWIIITDERRVGGMLAAARNLGGEVVAAVVGPRSLADTVAGMRFDRVLCFEPAAGIPAEAYAAALAEAVAAAQPGLVLASDVPIARMLLGAAAGKLNAAVLAAVRAVAVAGETIVVSHSAAEGKVLEDIEVAGNLAVIFDGDDVDMSSAQAAPVEMVATSAPAEMKVVETIEAEGGAGLLTASRVVSAGVGVRARDDLQLVEALAAAMHAEIACSLPVCDDLRWFPSHRVVGSTHNQIAPEIYVAVGISGQPQHLSGVRDAKIVVAINNDPEARIMKNCHYGILGDLYKIVPVLTEAFKNLA